MPKRSEPARGFFGLFGRKPADPCAVFDQARQQELAESMAILRQHRKAERMRDRAERLTALWPLGVGLLLAMLAPQLQALAAAAGPWGTTLVFPFVVLAARPEIQVGPITHLLPAIMLCAQFPIEGLLARIVLRRHVRPLGVAAQVLLFHFLGIAELFMLSGAAGQLLNR